MDAVDISTETITLRRALSLRAAVALGVGGTIGGGIFVLVGNAAMLAGPSALLAFGCAFVVALLIALPYAELACRYPAAGGGYAFVREILGREWGFLMGWVFWGAYVFISGYVTLGFGGYLNDLTGMPPLFGALGLVAACTLINIVGVRLSGQVQQAIILLALAGLSGFVLLGLPSITVAHFHPWMPHGMAGAMSATLMAFLAFGGFDMVAAAGEEVARPERNLPLAILLTLGIVLFVYLAVAFVALGTLGWRGLGQSSAPLADAACIFMGPDGKKGIALVAVLTMAATGNAVLVVTSRICFAMARDGLLPKTLARVQADTGVPWAATLLSAGMLGAVALTGSLRMATAVGGFLYAMHFVPPLLVLMTLRKRDDGSPPFRMPLPTVLLPLALGVSGIMLVASGGTGMLGGLIWIGVGAGLRWVSPVVRRRS